ncbi:MAG: hypothetical protein KAJ19_05325, partial [Gammaproteobacteria bacterium]|nr:hypothetical protein [Gammaproteobacteria bacterium]
DTTATAFLAKMGVTDKIHGFLAYSMFDDDNSATADNDSTTVGLHYMTAQNIKMELYRVMNSEGEDSTTFMMFAGF